MPWQRQIFRHALVSISFVLLYLLLNRPEVIFISRIGFVAWYPATGLVMALLLGVSPWYALLVCFADAFAGKGYLRPASHILQRHSWQRGKCSLLWRGGLRVARVPPDRSWAASPPGRSPLRFPEYDCGGRSNHRWRRMLDRRSQYRLG